MSDIPSDDRMDRSTFYRLKELYLALFVLLFRLSGWKGRLKAGTASTAVSVVLAVILLNVWTWIQIVSNNAVAMNRWYVMAAFIPFALANDYFLIIRGHGIMFEKRFRDFSAAKRGALYVAAISIILATAIAFYFLNAAYHRLLGLT